MTTCQITGHPDAYGVGIRTAFYLQWFGIVVVSWLLEPDALNLKFVNTLTIAAAWIGLAVNMDDLQPSEIYVVLLLVCGTLYFSVPLCLWRMATCCHPWWDPERWSRVRMGWLFKMFNMLMFGALLGLQLWFWCAGVHKRPAAGVDSMSPGASCVQYGFLFGQLPLDGPGVVAINIIVHLGILLAGTWMFVGHIGVFDLCSWRHRRKRSWSISGDRALSLQQFRSICDVCVAAVVIIAIELVISWNKIQGVNDLNSAAQLIPPVLSGAYLVRSIHVWLSGPEKGNGRNETHTNRDGGVPPRRRSSMVYIGPAGHRRRSSHSRHHRHRSRRTSSASPAMVEGFPSIADTSPVSTSMFMSAGPASFVEHPTAGQYDMTPPAGDVVDDGLCEQDHVYDEAEPYMAYSMPPADDFGFWSPEPPPTAASTHGGFRRHSSAGDYFNGYVYPSPLPGDFYWI